MIAVGPPGYIGDLDPVIDGATRGLSSGGTMVVLDGKLPEDERVALEALIAVGLNNPAFNT